MSYELTRVQFIITLRDALLNLYNPYELKHNPINNLLANQEVSARKDLKLILVESINALMPDKHTPPDTKAWKFYELLNYCFVDQIGQKEAAKNLLISQRTLQRLLPEAIETLAEHIINTYHLSLENNESEPGSKNSSHSEPGHVNEIWAKETTSLKSKSPIEKIDIRKMLKEIEQILQTMSEDAQSRIQIKFPDEAWIVMGQVTFLRQAVLTAISSFNRQKPGQIIISTERIGLQGTIQIKGQRKEGEFPINDPSSGADIPTALSNLMQILKGKVEIRQNPPEELSILLSFPAQKQYKIMVVDDNADAIRLVEKYLSGNIFSVIGVQDPERVISEIEKEVPFLILMDVMLPNIDGWMLLGQMEFTPSLAGIPVIISTILPQEDLSISLGANGFLRKPYSQQELLQILEAYILKSLM